MCELFDSPACYLLRVIESAPLHLCRVPSVAPAACPPLPWSLSRPLRFEPLTCANAWVVIFLGAEAFPSLNTYSFLALTFFIYRHLHTNRRSYESLR